MVLDGRRSERKEMTGNGQPGRLPAPQADSSDEEVDDEESEPGLLFDLLHGLPIGGDSVANSGEASGSWVGATERGEEQGAGKREEAGGGVLLDHLSVADRAGQACVVGMAPAASLAPQ